MAVIPQPLDVLDIAVNKGFQSNVRKLYNDWMTNEVHKLTPAGRIKNPSYSLQINTKKMNQMKNSNNEGNEGNDDNEIEYNN
ncbi:7017_t:CDS:2 [Funneliformis caledonium]|uniref:7017_t:CDS:1 n=1 Tax=Funneliformis caledonium TaxID=1117310 RepID=A0A9N9DEX7_9GLOM|nr:7017_t:CDS:2 [Funneliformis caledonium]